MRILAVVPARAGSKRVPGKNLKLLAGVSLVGRAVLTAQAVDRIEDTVVTTDSASIAQEAEEYGAITVMRPASLATDSARSHEAWTHAWLEVEKQTGNFYDVSVLLEPTSPLRQADDVNRCIAILESNQDFAAAATVSRTPATFTPLKTLLIDERGLIDFYLEDTARHSLRQTVPAYYHRNGVCYAVKRNTLLNEGHIIEKDCAAVILEHPVVNIDEPQDLEYAEFLLNRNGDPLGV